MRRNKYLNEQMTVTADGAKKDAVVVGDSGGIALKAEQIETAEHRPNRAERRREKSKRFQKKLEVAIAKDTTKPRVLVDEDYPDAKPVHEPKEFMDQVVAAQHKINKQLLARVKATPPEQRDVLFQMMSAMQLSVSLAYLEAYNPKEKHEQIFGFAVAQKANFSLKDSEGRTVKAPESAIILPPSVIIPG